MRRSASKPRAARIRRGASREQSYGGDIRAHNKGSDATSHPVEMPTRQAAEGRPNGSGTGGRLIQVFCFAA